MTGDKWVNAQDIDPLALQFLCQGLDDGRRYTDAIFGFRRNAKRVIASDINEEPVADLIFGNVVIHGRGSDASFQFVARILQVPEPHPKWLRDTGSEDVSS